MRKKIFAANWKMNITHTEAESYFHGLLSDLGEVNEVEVVLIPPFTSIPALTELSEEYQSIRLGAQNLHWEKSGAFTGEVSATMLRVLYVKYVIVGHSERRTLFGESNETVHRKVRAAIDAALRPILCVGETAEQRSAHREEEVLNRQLRSALEGVTAREMIEVVIAYEPIWAIGTGQNARPEQVEKIHQFVRKTIAELSDEHTADRVRIQYGGSVKPENAAEFGRQKNVDGALVGTASLEPRSFAQIVRAGGGLKH